MKTDSEFRKSIKDSEESVRIVAEWIKAQAKDYLVEVPDLKITPSKEERSQYYDNGDILMKRKDRETKRVEVKRRLFEFTNLQNYPYSTVIVSEVYKAQHENIMAFIVTNKSVTHAIIIPFSTKKDWKVISRYDPKDRKQCDFYEVSKDKCRCVTLKTGPLEPSVLL